VENELVCGEVSIWILSVKKIENSREESRFSCARRDMLYFSSNGSLIDLTILPVNGSFIETPCKLNS